MNFINLYLVFRAREGRLVYLLDGLGGLLWKVTHQAFQQRFNDELFELGLVHGGAVDPVVSTLPRLLVSLEDACLPHGFEEVDDASAADGLALEPLVHSIHDSLGAKALQARLKYRVGLYYIVSDTLLAKKCPIT